MAHDPRSTTIASARRRLLGAGRALWLALLLCACAAGDRPDGTGLATDLWLRRPVPVPGECWGDDTIPAVIESVTEQAAIRSATGTGPAYRTETRQRILQDRARVWFRAPCPADLTPGSVATLQRALKARGYYTGPLTGAMDAPTAGAIRRYQATRGLDTPTLSLDGARSLGVLPADPGMIR